MNAPTPRVRLVTLGDNPFPDIAPEHHERAHDLIGLVRQFEDEASVYEIAQFHTENNLGGVFDDGMVRRLVAYALRIQDADAGRDVSRFKLHTIPELLQRPFPTWTVRDVMPRNGLAVVYGGPGSGKTFLMLDMAMAIARGIQWHGRRTKQGVCVYIAGEGALRGRVTAYMRHNGLDDDAVPDFLTLESAVNFLDARADAADLIEAIQAKVGDRPVRLIVVDTLARSMVGGKENASEDMGAVISTAGKVSDAFDCLLAFVHHSGKDDTKGSRGHSSLKGACDVEISVRREDDLREAIAEKVRDGPDQSALLTFKLRSIDLGAVSDYDPDAEDWERITSCVIDPADGQIVKKKPPSGANQRNALTAIKAVMGANGKSYLTQNEAIEAIRSSTEMKRNRAHEAITGLIENGYLKHGSMGGIELADGA